MVRRLKISLEDDLLTMEVLLGVKEGRDVITYLKASGKMLLLSTAIAPPCTTRWNWLERSFRGLQNVSDEVRLKLYGE